MKMAETDTRRTAVGARESEQEGEEERECTLSGRDVREVLSVLVESSEFRWRGRFWAAIGY